jgi:hypothetical protein
VTARTASASALIDQTQAAANEAANHINAYATAHNTTPHLHRPQGAHAALTLQLATRLLAGTTRPCPHLHPNAPQPAYWIAWQPHRIRCVPCFTRVHNTIKGTDEDLRCDCCQHIGPTIIPGLLHIPAVVVPAAHAASGPIIATFGLCPTCQQTTGIAAADP